MRRRRAVARIGWTRLHTCGSAAINPTAPGPHPSAATAKAMTNGKLGIVRFSMGTLKQASMVADFSDNSSSRRPSLESITIGIPGGSTDAGS